MKTRKNGYGQDLYKSMAPTGHDQDMGGDEEDTGLETSDLEKSLQNLEANIPADSEDRKQALLKKAQTQDLTDEEKTDLFKAMGGQADDEEDEAPLSDSLLKSMAENPVVQETINISEFVAEQHGELVKSFGNLAAVVESNQTQQGNFNVALARAIGEVGRTVLDMQKSFAEYMEQPVRGPKSKMGQPLQKSFGKQAGPEAKGERLNKSEIKAGLKAMHKDSVDKGHQGLSPEGLPLGAAMGEFEQTGNVDRRLYNRIVQAGK